MKKRLLSVLLAWSVLMGALPVYALEDTSTAGPCRVGAGDGHRGNGGSGPTGACDNADPARNPGTRRLRPREDVSQEEVFEEEVTVDTSDAGLPDNEELFALYLQQQMYPDRVPSTMANWGTTGDALNENEQGVYNWIKDLRDRWPGVK